MLKCRESLPSLLYSNMEVLHWQTRVFLLNRFIKTSMPTCYSLKQGRICRLICTHVHRLSCIMYSFTQLCQELYPFLFLDIRVDCININISNYQTYNDSARTLTQHLTGFHQGSKLRQGECRSIIDISFTVTCSFITSFLSSFFL